MQVRDGMTRVGRGCWVGAYAPSGGREMLIRNAGAAVALDPDAAERKIVTEHDILVLTRSWASDRLVRPWERPTATDSSSRLGGSGKERGCACRTHLGGSLCPFIGRAARLSAAQRRQRPACRGPPRVGRDVRQHGRRRFRYQARSLVWRSRPSLTGPDSAG